MFHKNECLFIPFITCVSFMGVKKGNSKEARSLQRIFWTLATKFQLHVWREANKVWYLINKFWKGKEGCYLERGYFQSDNHMNFFHCFGVCVTHPYICTRPLHYTSYTSKCGLQELRDIQRHSFMIKCAICTATGN